MIDQARGGETIEALFRHHGPELRRHAARLLRGTSHDPDDVLQEVTLRALARHGDAPLDLAHPRAWLHTCVQNACLSHLRATRPTEPLDAEPALGEHHDPHAVVAARAEAQAVLEDLARLDDRQRRALLVSALGDDSHAAVAAALGGTERGVTSLVSRARTNMKAMRAARATPCDDIRAAIDDAAARGVRAPELVRRHALSCRSCRLYGEGRRRRSRIAGLLAPLHGLVAALSQRAGEALVPAAVDTGVVHGMAVMAVLAGGAATATTTATATGVHAAARAATPAPVVRTVEPRPVATAVVSPSRPARPHRAPARRKAAAPHAIAAPPAHREEPAPRNLFGCPKVTSAMEAADRRCRRLHRAEVRRAIEERLARQQVAAAAAAAAASPPATAPPAPATAAPSAPEAPPAAPPATTAPPPPSTITPPPTVTAEAEAPPPPAADADVPPPPAPAPPPPDPAPPVAAPASAS